MSSRKKRKLDTDEGETSAFIGDVVAEIDLEVRLRQRLVETLESRITWGLILQETLRKGSNGSTTSFENAAFDTLSAIEAPLDILFTREDPKGGNASTPSKRKPLHPPPRQKSTVKNSGANFLYINSGDLHPPYGENHVQTYLLRCPQCLRTAFTSLQGLLNHARLCHRLEWGTHDDCVRACAVRDSNLDTTLGIEVGLGPNGLLPGLRSLFKMAVGAHLPTPEPDPGSNHTEPAAQPLATGIHLVRTLGLHEDTPALAPFLGKQAIRRGIKAWNEEEEVDIDGLERHKPQATRHFGQNGKGALDLALHSHKHGNGWRMQYSHRNKFGSSHNSLESDKNMDLACGIDSGVFSERSQTEAFLDEANMSTIPDSRFHFMARIVVVDRSLWIPPERRQGSPNARSYKWMISIDSPSYTHHITTILQSVVVTSLSDSTGTFPVLTTSKPPFVVVGTADEPFLAEIELCFSGTSSPWRETNSQTVVLEHWVELDPLKSSAPAMGDEQVVDIELDKGTKLLPIQKGYIPIGAKSLWDEPSESNRKRRATRATSVKEYETILEHLVGQFPMTLKDMKGNRPPPLLPYRLATTTAQLKNMVHGRRKAIEWGRARSIRDAYMQVIRGQQHSNGLTPLATADVFNWLVEKGHFITRRLSPSVPKEEMNEVVKSVDDDRWCSFCGQKEITKDQTATTPMEAELETSTIAPGIKAAEDGIANSKCNPCCLCPPLERLVTKIPIVNVFARLVLENTTQDCDETALKSGGLKAFRDVDLVKAVHPQMTIAVRDIVHRLKLSSFLLPPGKVETSAGSKRSLEAQLAPHALLAIATQSFLRVLIEGGLHVSKKGVVVSGPTKSKRRPQVARGEGGSTSVLTPVHILSGLVSRVREPDVRGTGVNRMAYELLTRLGAPIEPQDRGITESEEETIPSVKMEEF